MHVVGTAGHVDHGKSTLVQALTGIDPDRFEEEKRRGLTIDLGFAWCTLPSGREIGIVDVPGHERFIRNMLAGVGGIDAAIFVVAADEGWMPQSTEHLQILDFLGVNKGVVALTKADLASQDDLDLVEEEVRAHLQDTPLTQAPIIRVSSKQRAGLDDLLAAVDESLGPEPEQTPAGRARLFVDRSFTIAGAGTVVTGTLTGGTLNVGDEVTIVPDGLRARIRSLQTHRASVTKAEPGSRVAANLVGLERHAVRRGDALVTDRWILSERFAARLRAARGLDHSLSEQGAYELFVGSAQTVCRLKFLDREGDLGPAESTLIEAFCERALPIVPGDRFVIRDVGRWQTVAGGAVIDQSPGRLRRGDTDAIRRLQSREGLKGAELAEHVIRERRAIAFDELASLTGIEAGELDTAIDRAAGRYSAGFVIASDHERGLETTARAALDDFHTTHPLDAGMPLDALCRSLGIDRLIAGEIVGEWQRAGWIVRDGNVVRLVDRGSTLTPDQRSTADRALEALRVGGVSPPRLGELGVPLSLAKALERSGELVMVSQEVAYPADVWADLQRRVVDLISANGPVTVSEIRAAIGTSRRYAVPLLEYMDSKGITRRRGDVRELGPRGQGL